MTTPENGDQAPGREGRPRTSTYTNSVGAASKRPARDSNGRFVKARQPAAARAVPASGDGGASSGKLTAKLDVQDAAEGNAATTNPQELEEMPVDADGGTRDVKLRDPETIRRANVPDSGNGAPTSGDTSRQAAAGRPRATAGRASDAAAAPGTDAAEEASVDGQTSAPPWLMDQPGSEGPPPAAAPIPLPADTVAPAQPGSPADEVPPFPGVSAGPPARSLDLPADAALPPAAAAVEHAAGIPIPPAGEPPSFEGQRADQLAAASAAGPMPGDPQPDRPFPGGSPHGGAMPGSVRPTGPIPGGAMPGAAMRSAAMPGGAPTGAPVPGAPLPGGPAGRGIPPGGTMPGSPVRSAPRGWSRSQRTARPARVQVGPARTPAQAPRKAQLTVVRIEPWSVMKFSFVISLVCFVALFVAVTVLYGALAGLGVFDSLQRTIQSVTSGQGSSGVNASHWFSASRILGYTGLIGTVNVILITAMSTVGAVLYNAASHLVGGVEVTLQETE